MKASISTLLKKDQDKGVWLFLQKDMVAGKWVKKYFVYDVRTLFNASQVNPGVKRLETTVYKDAVADFERRRKELPVLQKRSA